MLLQICKASSTEGVNYKTYLIFHSYQGKMMALMFYEVSTRTHCSFQAAFQRLGGRVVTMDANTSSVKKGETLEGKVDSFIHMSILIS